MWQTRAEGAPEGRAPGRPQRLGPRGAGGPREALQSPPHLHPAPAQRVTRWHAGSHLLWPSRSQAVDAFSFFFFFF